MIDVLRFVVGLAADVVRWGAGLVAENALLREQLITVHWLEAVYNRQRRHSAIDMLRAVDYKDRYWERRAAA